MSKSTLQCIIERNLYGKIIKNYYHGDNITIENKDKDWLTNTFYVNDIDLKTFNDYVIDNNIQIYKAYMDFLKLGEFINKNIIDIEKLNFYTDYNMYDLYDTQESILNYKVKNVDLLNNKILKWVNKYGFTLRGNYENLNFINTKEITDLSLFMYFIINSIYILRRKDTGRNNNLYEIQKFVQIKGKQKIKLESFLSYIINIIDIYQNKNRKLNEFSNLAFVNGKLKHLTYFNDIYSAFWFILKIHINYLYGLCDSAIYFHCQDCTTEYVSKGYKCDNCKKEWNKNRRIINIRNEKKRKELDYYIKNYNIDEELYNKAKQLLNKKHSYKDANDLDFILNKIKNKLNI